MSNSRLFSTLMVSIAAMAVPETCHALAHVTIQSPANNDSQASGSPQVVTVAVAQISDTAGSVKITYTDASGTNFGTFTANFAQGALSVDVTTTDPVVVINSVDVPFTITAQGRNAAGNNKDQADTVTIKISRGSS